MKGMNLYQKMKHSFLSGGAATIDVSVIAKAHGGGGHKGAAGFICDNLPF